MDADIAWEECIPDLPLDTNNLPPLNALSSSSDSSLNQLHLLDLLTFDHSSEVPDNSDIPPSPHQKLPLPHVFTPVSDIDTTHAESTSQCTSDSVTPTHPPNQKLPSYTTISRDHHNTPPTSPESDLVLELTTRLASAGAEATSLRKRVAALSVENRSLRASLDHANARLIAVAQAAAAQPPASSPVMLGLAQLPTDMATRFSSALTVSDTSDDSPRDRKKRKRVAGAATTMACVMFMWGALVGSPGLMKGSSTTSFRSEGNLPAVWKGERGGAVANGNAVAAVADDDRLHRRRTHVEGWQPNCMRVLSELPDGSEIEDSGSGPDEDDTDSDCSAADVNKMHGVNHVSSSTGRLVKKEAEEMFVDMKDEASANVVAHSDAKDASQPQYSYVLCRDTRAAIDSVRGCSDKIKRGEACGQPHTISLILPAATAGMGDDNETGVAHQPALAEVQCSILSVARIPVDPSTGKIEGKHGRVLATVPETGTVIRE